MKPMIERGSFYDGEFELSYDYGGIIIKEN